MKACRYCKAPITFIRTEKGRLMPVEPEPITVITAEGVTIKKAYLPHFANCKPKSELAGIAKNLDPQYDDPTTVDPDSKAAYSHWNEEAERVYYQEHPEVFGR